MTTANTTARQAEALHSAVAAIYFADSSDYLPALWSVVQHLEPELVAGLRNSPKLAFNQSMARVEAASRAVQIEGVAKAFVMAPLEATDDMLEATRGPGMSPGTWNNYAKSRHAQLYRQMIGALAAKAPQCDTCNDTGQRATGHSGRESDGNAMEFERCPECGYGDAAPAPAAQACNACNGTGEVSDMNGEFRGYCWCGAKVSRRPADAASEADKRDAERYQLIKRSGLILSGGYTKFGWPISPFGDQCDKYLDAVLQRERQQGADRG